LYGITNFLETGMFGRVGRAGLQAIKHRQYEEEAVVTQSILESFALITDLLSLQPRREYQLFSRSIRRVLVAADASYEAGVGRAGFLLVFQPGTPEESRVGRVLDIPRELYHMWGVQSTYIAQLELVVLLAALVEFAESLRGTRGIWFTDNTAALMALVHGKSDSLSLDVMAKFAHMACFALHTAPYFEYVESAANWADEISRRGLSGEWAQQQKFLLGRCTFVPQLLALPSVAMARVISFL
jgi:hypothetical protein